MQQTQITSNIINNFCLYRVGKRDCFFSQFFLSVLGCFFVLELGFFAGCVQESTPKYKDVQARTRAETRPKKK